jgi:hypothetical protein
MVPRHAEGVVQLHPARAMHDEGVVCAEQAWGVPVHVAPV